MKLCQELSNVNHLSSYVSFAATSYTLAVSSSDQLIAFDPTTLTWLCWGVSLFSLFSFDIVDEDDDEDEERDRNYERMIGFMFELTFIQMGICTPLICVFWWPNAVLYVIVYGTIFMIILIAWNLDTIEHQIPLAFIVTILCSIVLGFSVAQLYIVTHNDFYEDAYVLACVGAGVAAFILGVAYISIGCVAVEIMLHTIRGCLE